MFSRVSRLTTLGAHAITNCPYRRDKTYQPQRLAAPINDQLFSFAHSFSDSIHPRATSIGSDPFFGVITDEEREVIKELELLDLDSWQADTDRGVSNTLPVEGANSMIINATPQPSDDLDFNEWSNYTPFNQNRNGFLVCAHNTKRLTNEEVELDELDNLNAITGNKNTIAVCGRDPRKPDEEIKHEHPSESILQRSDSLAPLFAAQPKCLESSKFEFDVENAAKMVDWEAWNKYLGEDEPQSIDTYEPSLMDEVNMSSFDYPSVIPLKTTNRTIPQQTNSFPVHTIQNESRFQDLTLDDAYSPVLDRNNEFEFTSRAPNTTPNLIPKVEDDWLTSGPLTYVPPKQQRSVSVNPPKTRIRKTRELRSSRSSVRVASQRSWTPMSDDLESIDNEEKPKFKKRGVIMKPSVDDETDRRRALNRNAALRYREKKRLEKLGRNREYQEVALRNRELHLQQKQLKKEIREIRNKLERYGVL